MTRFSGNKDSLQMILNGEEGCTFSSEEDCNSDDERQHIEERSKFYLKVFCLLFFVFAFMRKKQYYVTVLHYGRERSKKITKRLSNFHRDLKTESTNPFFKTNFVLYQLYLTFNNFFINKFPGFKLQINIYISYNKNERPMLQTYERQHFVD